MVLLHFCEQRFSDVLGAVDAAGVRTKTHTDYPSVFSQHNDWLIFLAVVCTWWTKMITLLLMYTKQWIVTKEKSWKEKLSPFLTQLFNLLRILHEHMDNLQSMLLYCVHVKTSLLCELLPTCMQYVNTMSLDCRSTQRRRRGSTRQQTVCWVFWSGRWSWRGLLVLWNFHGLRKHVGRLLYAVFLHCHSWNIKCNYSEKCWLALCCWWLLQLCKLDAVHGKNTLCSVWVCTQFSDVWGKQTNHKCFIV